MSSKLKSIIGFYGFLLLISILKPSTSNACTYEATITNNHVDFKITSDTNNLGLIQYIRQSGSSIVTKMFSPNVSDNWVYSDDPCNTYTIHPLACRQNRGQLGDSAYWYWSVNGDGNFPNHQLPDGIWGMDFNTSPTYESLGIEYGSTNGALGDFWHLCTRSGEVTSPAPSPSPSPTPTASPSPTPSPSPSPTPTPTPITKVFLVPGLGASWNPNALLNCTPDFVPSNWSLADYATTIYQPLFTALATNNWTVIPYYYDWRQEITRTESKNAFVNFINQNTSENEAINIVGHSMGGLIAREYLETSGGTKLNNLLTAGTPNKGSAFAYPAWSGGEIWNDNFLAKVAITLYIKHCGRLSNYSTDKDIIRNIFPSIQNLLPIENYLKPTRSFIPPNAVEMEAKNNWLFNDSSGWPNIGSVRVSSLSGSSFSTLSSIPVKEGTNRDKSLGLWFDGKPSGKEFSYQGDGTVLTASSQIHDTDPVINQSHSGLVASGEGICKILEFLGSPCPTTTALFTEPNSALIVVGYPANFWVTDQKGNTRKDSNGMISFINPKSGSYKLSVLSISNNIQVIIAQFLPNGDIKYKEYNFAGFGPKFKTLNFNLENPQEDILR